MNMDSISMTIDGVSYSREDKVAVTFMSNGTRYKARGSIVGMSCNALGNALLVVTDGNNGYNIGVDELVSIDHIATDAESSFDFA